MTTPARDFVQFLENRCINNGTDLRAAIRDTLTDCLHIANHFDEDVTFDQILQDAKEVFKEEVELYHENLAIDQRTWEQSEK